MNGLTLLAAVFYLNACCAPGYQIMRYEAGQPVPPRAVIHDGTDPGRTDHFAWPSAIGHRVWASRKRNGRWNDVSSWISRDGVNLQYEGEVATAPRGSDGIGPSQVYVAPDDPRPYKMVVLLRKRPIGTQLLLASSVTGDPGTWNWEGVVMEVSEPWEQAGFAPSFVTQAQDGRWVLSYQAYETVNKAHGAIAIADSPNGPWEEKHLIMRANGVRLAVTHGKRLSNTVTSTQPVEIGVPYVLKTTNAMELVVPEKQAGNTVYFTRPLLADYPTAELVHIAAAKPDPSYLYQLEDGSWRGVFTGFGHFPGVTSEYTFSAEAPTLTGPWAIRPEGVPFAPWVVGGQLSTENPTPALAP